MKNTKKQNLVDGPDQKNPNLERTDKLIAEETHNPNAERSRSMSQGSTVAEPFDCAQDRRRRSTYFISDLHLDPSHPHLFDLFDKFIEKIRPDAEALYILGDLFEFWIGDDIIDLPIGKPYLPVIKQLRSLSDSGVKIFFIQGNRDFLIGKKFMQAIGGKLLPDQCIIDLYGTPALIMHGDTLCTDDKGYQWMRKIFRLKIVQKIYLSMSPEKRAQKAGQVRKTTSESTKQKNAMILDVNQQTVNKCIESGGVSFLIHGHTHRPAEHEFKVDDSQKMRIVLGDWGDECSYLEWSLSTAYKLIY